MPHPHFYTKVCQCEHFGGVKALFSYINLQESDSVEGGIKVWGYCPRIPSAGTCLRWSLSMDLAIQFETVTTQFLHVSNPNERKFKPGGTLTRLLNVGLSFSFSANQIPHLFTKLGYMGKFFHMLPNVLDGVVSGVPKDF